MDNLSKRRKRKANIWITVIFAAAIFVVFNIMLKTLAQKVQLSFDMTPNKLFVLSDETNTYLDNLTESVTMYYLIEPGSESPYITEVIERYEKKSDKITVKKVDPVRNPAFTSKYTPDGEAIQKGTIIVESEKRYALVDPGAALTIIRDKNGNVSRSLGFTLEQKLTNAIDFAVRDSNVTVRYAVGHKGLSFTSPASKIRAENIDVKKTVLSDDEITPENTDLLILFGFREDLSNEEFQKVCAYLNAGGNLFITLDPGIRPEKILKIAADYGITVENNMLSEGNKGDIIGGNEHYLMAVSGDHKICENLKKASILFPSASSVRITENEGVKASYLMKTKISAKANELLDGETGRKTGEGSFGIAALGERGNSKVFVASTSGFLVPDDSKINNILNVVDYQNREFFVQTVKYLTNSENLLVSVSAKSIDSRNFMISNNKKFIYIILFGGILPFTVFVLGFILWFKRRNL